MKKVIIFGISGFTGYHFQSYIKTNKLYESFEFIGIDKKIPTIDQNSSFIKFIELDIKKKKKLKDLILKMEPNYIVNLIGLYNTQDFDELISINTNFPKNLITILLENKLIIDKILFIGSAAEYGTPTYLPQNENDPLEPINPYGLSKVLQTIYVQYFHRISGLKCNIARTFNIVGKGLPKSLSLGRFFVEINNKTSGESIEVGNIKTKRDFLDVRDVIDAYWKILINGKPGEIYNVCMGQSSLIEDLVKKMIENSNKKLKIKVNNNFLRKNDILDSFGNNSKLRKLGWKATINIHESLSKMNKKLN